MTINIPNHDLPNMKKIIKYLPKTVTNIINTFKRNHPEPSTKKRVIQKEKYTKQELLSKIIFHPVIKENCGLL